MIGHSFEFIWSFPNGDTSQVEVGPHKEADFEAFHFGKTRRVGTRYEDDSITFWSPNKTDSIAQVVFMADLETLNIRKITT